MDVCAKLKGLFQERRVGHAGTLDPMATGVLPVFLGRATRTVEFAVDHAVSVRTLRDPKRCQHVQTVVDGQAAPPVVRDGIRLYNMQVA